MLSSSQAANSSKIPLCRCSNKSFSSKHKSCSIRCRLDTAKLQLEAEKIKAQNQREGAKLGVTLATELDKNQREDQQAGAKLGIEVAKELLRGMDDTVIALIKRSYH